MKLQSQLTVSKINAVQYINEKNGGRDVSNICSLTQGFTKAQRSRPKPKTVSPDDDFLLLFFSCSAIDPLILPGIVSALLVPCRERSAIHFALLCCNSLQPPSLSL
jgi:hypothetical protein